MISISISTKRSEKRKPTGERVGEEAGMDVDSRKVVRGRIGLVRCVSGRMLGYPMNLKRRMLPRFLRIGGKWEGGWESGKGDAGRGVCGVGSSGIVFDCIKAICVDTLIFTYSSVLFFNPLSF